MCISYWGLCCSDNLKKREMFHVRMSSSWKATASNVRFRNCTWHWDTNHWPNPLNIDQQVINFSAISLCSWISAYGMCPWVRIVVVKKICWVCICNIMAVDFGYVAFRGLGTKELAASYADQVLILQDNSVSIKYILFHLNHNSEWMCKGGSLSILSAAVRNCRHVSLLSWCCSQSWCEAFLANAGIWLLTRLLHALKIVFFSLV